MRIRADLAALITLVVILLAGCGGSGSGDSATGTFDLAVSLDGPGTGTVSSQPSGIDCGTDCSEIYAANTLVTLSASRAAGSVFAGWSGACSGTGNCEVLMDAERSVTATFVEYAVDCSASASYVPLTKITVPSSAGPASTTVILMHGKTADPSDPDLPDLYNALSAKGYDVIAPDMPWSDTVWGGSMCEAMNLIDDLAAEESAQGRDVVVAGHSMGGAHALIYAVTAPSVEVKALIALAPGHFPHLEGIAQAAIADDITRAEGLVASGLGDSIDTFDTIIPDPISLIKLVPISITAIDYLSYHALDQYPDVRDVLPPIKLPVLWLAGSDDPLTDFYNMPALADQITSVNSVYMEVIGSHLDMISNTPDPIGNWLDSLGL